MSKTLKKQAPTPALADAPETRNRILICCLKLPVRPECSRDQEQYLAFKVRTIHRDGDAIWNAFIGALLEWTASAEGAKRLSTELPAGFEQIERELLARRSSLTPFLRKRGILRLKPIPNHVSTSVSYEDYFMPILQRINMIIALRNLDKQEAVALSGD